MPLPPSSLSLAADAIAAFLREGLDAAANHIEVTLGAPAGISPSEDQHRLNLFFYRFAPSGFESAVHPREVRHLRMYALLTAIAGDEGEVSAGENDLRLLGEVMRLFHETPILPPIEINGETVRVNAVMLPMSDEQLNQIWSTQGDASSRPSLVYEFSLVPLVPSERRVQPPVVGALGVEARPGLAAGAAFDGTLLQPLPRAVLVDLREPTWQPRLCWLHQGECALSLSLDVNSPAFAAFSPNVWVAGDATEELELVWELWRRGVGWRSAGAAIRATPFSAYLDPEQIPAAVPGTFPLELELPAELPADEDALQALLYARRNVTLADGSVHTIRSNPLLVSLYRGQP